MWLLRAGAFCWVGVPKAILLNGKGNYYSCEDVYTRQVCVFVYLSAVRATNHVTDAAGAGLHLRSNCAIYGMQVGQPMWNGQVANTTDLMQPNPCTAGQLGGTAAWPVCKPTPPNAAGTSMLV